MKKKIPRFSSEGREREFWAREDSTGYLDWSKAKRVVLPDLKPSLKTISLRLPELLLEELKVLANKYDVPYQSLLKMFLAERIERELRSLDSGKARSGLRQEKANSRNSPHHRSTPSKIRN
jgi:predicted DNA binding CopG/RHH family protein